MNSFLTVAQTRESVYSTIDTMSNDETISAILETYAEDAVETNDKGKIVWCESADADVNKYVSWLLESLNVDKHIYGWMYSLIKYGDLYLKLYHESDYESDDIFTECANKNKSLNEDFKDYTNGQKAPELKEGVNVKLNSKSDHFVHYVEAVSNPCEMFELTRFGKTAGYIEAPTMIQNPTSVDSYNSWQFYNMKQSDINVYAPTDYVHAVLEDNSSRKPEEVNIFRSDADYDNKVAPIKYKVKRGQSLLYNSFKIWRILSLLEDSVLLNRVTKSSIIRLISVEVGDMPKDKVQAHLQNIKKLIEQKSALNVGNSMNEYNNPGPVENNIYIPTHEGKGAITTSQIGGDVDPKQLTDLAWFQNKFFGSYRIPKQYFGVTDDSTGFNGGSSLSIISSRYGKAVKRIQNAMIQMLTDLINIFLLDKQLYSYVNKFTLRMQAPITQEELDKRDNLSNRIRVVGDLMTILTDIEDPVARLKILKSLLSTAVPDSDIIADIQDVIDKLAAKEEKSNNKDDIDDNKNKDISDMPISDIDETEDTEEEGPKPMERVDVETETEETPKEEVDKEDSYLPSPDELNFNAVENA